MATIRIGRNRIHDSNRNLEPCSKYHKYYFERFSANEAEVIDEYLEEKEREVNSY